MRNLKLKTFITALIMISLPTKANDEDIINNLDFLLDYEIVENEEYEEYEQQMSIEKELEESIDKELNK